MFIFWLALIGIVVYALLAKPGKRIGDWSKASDDPVDILKKRYVNGEITEEEYKKILKNVNN